MTIVKDYIQEYNYDNQGKLVELEDPIHFHQEYTFPIPNLHLLDDDDSFGSTTFPLIEFQHDDRGPDGRFVRFHAPEGEDSYFFDDLSRSTMDHFYIHLNAEARRQQRKREHEARQAFARAKGRNLAAFRQTLGNKRPANRNIPNGYWYEGRPNPALYNTNAINVTASHITGKQGTIGQQEAQLKEIVSRPFGGPGARRRKTRRRRN